MIRSSGGVSFSDAETRAAGRLAQKLGGYEEMLRLEKDLETFERSGTKPRLERAPDGRLRLVPELSGRAYVASILPARPARKPRPLIVPVTVVAASGLLAILLTATLILLLV